MPHTVSDLGEQPWTRGASITILTVVACLVALVGNDLGPECGIRGNGRRIELDGKRHVGRSVFDVGYRLLLTGLAGCSKRPSSKAAGESKPEAYPLGYVEDFDEPRTKRADFFRSLQFRLYPCR